MSPIATLIILALAAGLWFAVLRPRLRGRAPKRGGDGSGAMPDGQHDRHDGGNDAADGDGGDGGGDGGGD